MVGAPLREVLWIDPIDRLVPRNALDQHSG
jgi:hypothetical protein